MLDFLRQYQKQITYGVIIVVAAVVVYLIYRYFIKNALIRELYEDIKIVIESKCPDGYAYDKNLPISGNRCTICQAPNVVPAGGETPCGSCNQNQGQVVNFVTIASGTDASKKAGLNCIACSNGQTPDPNPDDSFPPGQFKNDRTTCVDLLVNNPDTDTALSSLGTTSSLIATSAIPHINNLRSRLYAITCRRANDGTPQFITSTPSPSAQGSIGGQKIFTYQLFGVNVLNDARQATFNFTTAYNNRSVGEIWSYLNFLFSQASLRIRDYFTSLIQSTNSDININSSMINIADIRFLDSNRSNPTSPSASNTWRPAFVQIPISWSCGVPTSTLSSCYTENGVSKQDRTNNYFYNISQGLNTTEFTNSCPTTLTKIDCTAGRQDCVVNQNASFVSVDRNIMAFNPTDNTYTYTNRWTFPVITPGVTPGRLCEDPTNYIVRDSTTNNPVGSTDPKFLSTPTANEISYIPSLGQTVINRTCKISYGSTIFVALPGGYANVTLPSYATPTSHYVNPTDYADRFANKFLLYKTPSATSLISGPAGALTCAASNNSLEVLSITQGVSPSFDNYTSNVRTTMINAKRNIYEQVSVDIKDVGQSFYIRDKLRFLLGRLGVFSSDSVIDNIYLASSSLNTATPSQYKTSITANNNLSPLDPLTSISTFNIWPIVTTGVTFPKNTILAMSADGSRTAACINEDKLYNVSTANISTGNVIGTASTTFVSTTANPLRWSWISINNGSTGVTGGLCQTAVAYNGSIYTSYNSGTNWLNQSRISYITNDVNGTPAVDNWSQVCMSDDGSMQFAISAPGFIYYSINGGLNWTRISNSFVTQTGTITITPPTGTPPPETLYNWTGIDCNSDGTQFSVCMRGGQIYYGRIARTGTFSTPIPNTGTQGVSVVGPASVTVTLTRAGNASGGGNPMTGSANWRQISLSRSGRYQTAVINGAYLARSIDNGVTWSFPSAANTNGFMINGGVSPFKSWVDVKIAPNTDTVNEGRYQVAIESSKSSIGESPDSIGVFWTNDYGATWYPITSLTYNKNLCNVEIDSNRNIYLTATDGTLTMTGPIPA